MCCCASYLGEIQILERGVLGREGGKGYMGFGRGKMERYASGGWGVFEGVALLGERLVRLLVGPVFFEHSLIL